jgi:hypothetical protein
MTPVFSDAFRFRRAIRVIAIDDESIDQATSAFDNIVAEIEHSVIEEAVTGSIGATWAASCSEEETCAACDFRFFCPSQLARRATGNGDIAEDDDDGV